MKWVRVWLPVGIVVAGVGMIAGTGGSIEGWEGGGAMIGAGLSVWLLNLFFRVGVAGDRERDAEDRARAFYDEHGYWPDEAPARPAQPGTAAEPESPGDLHRRPGPGGPAGAAPRHPPRRLAGQGRRPRRP
jgi:hypothetical protein